MVRREIQGQYDSTLCDYQNLKKKKIVFTVAFKSIAYVLLFKSNSVTITVSVLNCETRRIVDNILSMITFQKD